jgi:DNA-binding XRE family transcriptional regulator
MTDEPRGCERGSKIPGRQPGSEFDAALCQRVGELRRAAGLTQAQVAEALGIHKRTYQHCEHYQPLPASLILPFADLIGIDVRDLLHVPRSDQEEALWLKDQSDFITWRREHPEDPHLAVRAAMARQGRLFSPSLSRAR